MSIYLLFIINTFKKIAISQRSSNQTIQFKITWMDVAEVVGNKAFVDKYTK